MRGKLNSPIRDRIQVRLLDLTDWKQLVSFFDQVADRFIFICFGKLLLSHNFRRQVFKQFLKEVYKLNKTYGAKTTVKYLKVCSVAIQKYLGGDSLSSTRVIEPSLPIPGLIKGLPSIIPKSDRLAIRDGNINIIRFWLSCFNIYRVIDCPISPKLNTITDGFSGKEEMINSINSFSPHFVDHLVKRGFRPHLDNLKIWQFAVSWAASATNKVSWKGILGDFKQLFDSSLRNPFLRYIRLVGSPLFDSLSFERYPS